MGYDLLGSTAGGQWSNLQQAALVCAALAAQKNYNSLYLNCIYCSAERSEMMRDGFAKAGKKLDMGKSCIRFRQADDLALDAIADVIGSITPEEFSATAQAARRELHSGGPR